MRAIYTRLILTAVVVVVADQVTKQLALDNLRGDGVDILGGLVTLRLAYNPGGAFGILPGVPWLFAVAAAIIGVVVVWTARQAESKGAAIALGLILGGGVGNIVDRVFRDLDGRVVDFVDLHWWPLFNLADAAIVFGVVFLLWSSIRSARREKARSDA